MKIFKYGNFLRVKISNIPESYPTLSVGKTFLRLATSLMSAILFLSTDFCCQINQTNKTRPFKYKT